VNIFDNVDKIDQRVKAGEITGRVEFPEKGEAILFAVETRSNSGQNFITFHLALADNLSARGAFDVRLPLPTDKDAGQYLGMQRVYNTLHACGKKNPKIDSTGSVYTALENFLGKNSMRVGFEIENRVQWSERHAKNFTNQDLKALHHIGVVPHVGLQAPKPKAAQPAYGQAAAPTGSPWNKGAGDGYKAPAIDEDVPF
jgi:hypothetical protein